MNRRRPSLKLRLIVAGAIVLFGALFASIGLLIWSGSQPYNDGIITTGEVTEHIRNADRTGIAPVVTFTTEEGQEVTIQSSVYTNRPAPIGSFVEVSYEPDDPAAARNLDDGSSTLGLIFGGLGTLVLLIGLAVGVSGFRRRPSVERGATTPSQIQRPPASWEDRQWDMSQPKRVGDTDFIDDADRGF